MVWKSHYNPLLGLWTLDLGNWLIITPCLGLYLAKVVSSFKLLVFPVVLLGPV